MSGLKKIVNNMPKAIVRLCEMKGTEVVDEAKACSLPISDHDLIIGENCYGTFATWNPLNPDSPVSPGYAPEGVTGLRRLYYEGEKHEHIYLVTQTIIDLFKEGVDALALQEIPTPSEPFFKPFIERLQLLAQEKHLDLDFDAFSKSFAPTKKALISGQDQRYNRFGTALLLKKGNLTLDSVTPLEDGRGASYSLTSSLFNKKITLINVHGHYSTAEQLAAFIAEAVLKPSTMVLGDTNINLTKQEVIANLAKLKGVLVEPSTNIEGTAEADRTLDCFLTNISTDYDFKKGCKNLAQYKERRLWSLTIGYKPNEQVESQPTTHRFNV